MEPTNVVEGTEVQTTKILIPKGLNPGETFMLPSEQGQPCSVTVPKGAKGGDYIDICLPEPSVPHPEEFVTINKATLGAAVTGLVLGSLIFGLFGGFVLACGAVYCSSDDHGAVGDITRQIGISAYKGMEDGKKLGEKLESMWGKQKTVPSATVVDKREEVWWIFGKQRNIIPCMYVIDICSGSNLFCH